MLKREWYATKELGDKIEKKKLEAKMESILKAIGKIEDKYPMIGSKSSRTLIMEDLKK